MIGFARRNLLLFFRDKNAVFFSLLAVFIIIGLYALFLGDVWASNYPDIDNIRFLMDRWIMAGLLAVTSVTTTMGAFGALVSDREKKIYKDFNSAPISRSSIAGGYMISAFVIGCIMSFVALILVELYIVSSGGKLLSVVAFAKVVALILGCTFVNTTIMFFVVSFFKSNNAFATASTVIGTLIGFLTGIYVPIGALPDAVQLVIKVFPVSHAVSIFRQVIMDVPLSKAFAGAPAETLIEFEKLMGVTYYFGDTEVSVWISILILIITTVICFGLAVLNMSRKNK
ncbi:ABC transporter permease [Paenibacillus crassostreae]|uniref:Transport permease protein n=1 Tax=Paenibacillus crassostreae TaxID=1763538 RepID=A0A167DQZ8_9BACL|nr:ABC transporter permease [Paenibacillus crassostreae]AOZ91162.1 ABC transporter [Paenibacillus crassostreae]OAB74678.1 ABC transporter [Paenibacillus crassostreae]